MRVHGHCESDESRSNVKISEKGKEDHGSPPGRTQDVQVRHDLAREQEYRRSQRAAVVDISRSGKELKNLRQIAIRDIWERMSRPQYY